LPMSVSACGTLCTSAPSAPPSFLISTMAPPQRKQI
jgi:hypothetical protein